MTLTLGLLYDRVRWEEKTLARKARDRGFVVKATDVKTLRLDSSADRHILAKELGAIALQRCVSYYRGLHLAAFLEAKGIVVINPFSVLELCGNKLFTTLALWRAGVPTPRTVLAFSPQGVLNSSQELGYPAVLKPVVGSWGRAVALLRDPETAKTIVEMREQLNGPLGQIYYVQEAVTRPPRDIRVIAIDGRIVASVYRLASPGEWRTNVARGGNTAPCPILGELEEIVARASAAVGGGVLGIDVMESPTGLLVHEVNGTVEFRGAAQASEVDIADAILDYVVHLARR